MDRYNIPATLRYNFSKKKEPNFVEFAKLITIPNSQMTPKTMSKWDMSNYQFYANGPSFDVFTIQKLEKTLSDDLWLQYINEGGDPSLPKHKWNYLSNACNSYRLFRLDIARPGRIAMKCTLPLLGCASGWLYSAQNKGDYEKGWLLPIDKTMPRDYYFEIDLFETFYQFGLKRLVFSGHYGTQANRKMCTTGILTAVEGWHYPEVVWDGRGTWYWYLDGIFIVKQTIPQPADVFPYFKLTFAVMEEFPSNIEMSEWKVDYIKFSSVISLNEKGERI